MSAARVHRRVALGNPSVRYHLEKLNTGILPLNNIEELSIL